MSVGVDAASLQADRVLLVEIDDESGSPFNLLGGGVEPGESLHAALRREVLEETGMEAKVGRLLLTREYFPPDHGGRSGPEHKLGLVFAATLRSGVAAGRPSRPDAGQVGARWVALSDLGSVALLPRIAEWLAPLLRGGGTPGLFLTDV